MQTCPHCGSTEYVVTVNGCFDYHYKNGKRVAVVWNYGTKEVQCSNCGNYIERRKKK